MEIKLVNKDAMLSLAPGEEARINEALAALAADPHAPSEITVKMLFNVYREYPKAVHGKTVNSKAEEDALKAKATPKPAPVQEAKPIHPVQESHPVHETKETTK